MKENYTIFRKFPTIELAQDLMDTLNEHGIKSLRGDNIPPVDITFSGNTLQNEYEVQIAQSDFKKAEKILDSNAKKLIEDIDKDYYLFEFTNEELYEILLKSDEWNSFDYKLAQEILLKRGKTIDEDLLNSLKQERLNQLAQPEGNQKPWIMAGYIFALLGGLVGIVIGYFLWTSKKSLPNGKKVFSYADNDRKHGKYIFYISLIIAPASILLRVFSQF